VNDRDRLLLLHIHGYFEVDLNVVWQTAEEALPPFVAQVRAILTGSG
jgi:uncharacterized protein with HEPN domain